MTVRMFLFAVTAAIVFTGIFLLRQTVGSGFFSNSATVAVMTTADQTVPAKKQDESDFIKNMAAALGPWQEDATRQFKSIGLKTYWKTEGGDWFDAGGVARGPRPFAAVSIPDIDAVQTVEINVTNYVREFGGDFALRTLRGTLTFLSRESEDGPMLEVDGQRYKAIADTMINPTTVKPLGKGKKLGSQDLILIRFDVGPGDYGAARLTLTTTDKQYGNIDLGVFRSDNSGPDLPPRRIEATPLSERTDILLHVKDAETWKAFQRGSGHIPAKTTEDGTLYGIMPKGLRQETFLNLIYKFEEHGIDPPDHAFFRYRLRIKNWSTTMAGKLPGLAGTYGRAGWGGRNDQSGTKGWSSRGFMDKVSAGNNLLPIGQYIYHMDAGAWGDVSRAELPLPQDRWVWIEQEVKLNSVGKADGLVRTWIDGYLMQERRNLRFRSVGSIHIDRLWMNIYFGGTGYVADATHEYWISDVAVARAYIGPG